MADYLKKLGDKASNLYAQGKALLAPEDEEAKSFAEKQAQLDEAGIGPDFRMKKMNAEPEAQAPTVVYPMDHVSHVPPQEEVYPVTMQPLKDKQQPLRVIQMPNAGLDKPQLPVPQELHPTQEVEKTPVGVVPSYDDGGDVEDDQVAKLHAGEKVLDPEQAQEYRAETEGAPADFGGRVIPNPKGIKVTSDTEGEMPDYKMQGIKMDTKNAPLQKLAMDTTNAAVDKTGPVIQEASTPLSKTMSSGSTAMKPLVARPSYQPQIPGVITPAPEEQKPDFSSIIQKGKEDAAKNGDIVALGKAMINEKLFAPKEDKKDEVGPQLVQETPEVPQYTGDERVGKGTPGEAEARQQYQGKIQDYNSRIQSALDKGTPEGRAEAASIELAKSHFEKQHPFGSPENHPGILGKIEHGLAKAGNIAGDIVAPGTMALIPGTALNKQLRAGQAGEAITAADEQRGKEATAAETETKPELQQKAQKLQAEKIKTSNEAQLRKAGYKTNELGEVVPLSYEELSEVEQGKHDLNEAKSNAQNSIAELKKAQADPNSPQSQAIFAKIKDSARKIDIAAGKLGLDSDIYKAKYLGIDAEGKPLAGVETTAEGTPIGTEVSKGNQATSQRLNKADLSQNVQLNVAKAKKLIANNPGLFGKVQGRFTNAEQLIGSNDEDLQRLGVAVHNMAVASAGIHGQRGQAAVEAYEKDILNKFHNSPEATIAAMDELGGSVQTFIDDAKAGKHVAPTPTTKAEVPTGVPKDATHIYKDKQGKIRGYAEGGKYHELTTK
jgi:hypothetical protein